MDNETTGGGGFMTPFLVGTLVGGVAALLLAPCSGTEMRTKIRNKLSKLKEQGEEVFEDAGDLVSEKAHEVSEKLNKRMVH